MCNESYTFDRLPERHAHLLRRYDLTLPSGKFFVEHWTDSRGGTHLAVSSRCCLDADDVEVAKGFARAVAAVFAPYGGGKAVEICPHSRRIKRVGRIPAPERHRSAGDEVRELLARIQSSGGVH